MTRQYKGTPIDWRLVKRDYENNHHSIAKLCQIHAITQSQLYRVIKFEGWQLRHKNNPPKFQNDKAVLVARLYQALEKQVTSIERQIVNISPRLSGNREVITRHLAVLAKVLEKLIELEEQTNREKIDNNQQEKPLNLEQIKQFRNQLKERLERMLNAQKN